jgi:hypothetical protein
MCRLHGSTLGLANRDVTFSHSEQELWQRHPFKLLGTQYLSGTNRLPFRDA